MQTGFKDFDFELLKNYERWILNTIAFSISPQVAPTIFVQEFLQFCSSNVDKTEITKISDSLISKFLEGEF